MSVIDITKSNYKQEVADYKGTVLRTDIKVGKVNVDDQLELGRLFKIMNIPTLVVIKDGEVVKTQIGAVPKEKILELLA